MYPERRPYATTVPHSGYRAKSLIPQPPPDALAILRSHVGYDDLHNCNDGEHGMSSRRTAAGRTYPMDAFGASSDASPVARQQLLPLTDRSSQQALDSARLQPPIEYESLIYHGCQQAVLNSELREKLEVHNNNWSARITALQAVLSELPNENSMYHVRGVEALRSYLTAYRCTEDLSVSPAEVVQQRSLRTPLREIDNMTKVHTIPMDSIRRTLDDLLRSPYLLAPLEPHLEQLSVFDAIAQLPWSGEGEAAAQEDRPRKKIVAAAKRLSGDASSAESNVTVESGAAAETAAAAGTVAAVGEEEEDVFPSRASVALHERLHYNPGDYAQRELKKSEEALAELQAHVQGVKAMKEAAIDAEDPLTALRNLHAQVDFSNDLLLMYKARMALVNQHADDTREFRREVVSLIDDGRGVVDTVQTYTRKALPNVQHDISALKESEAEMRGVMATMQQTEIAANEQMRAHLGSLDQTARELWEQVSETLEKIAENARVRARFTQQCMSKREQRAKEMAALDAQLRAHAAHTENLRRCESILNQWGQAGEVYQRFMDALVPKVLKHLAVVEEADADLAQREAEEYVGYFEQFVYAAEEARAKRCTQADRMRLLQRSTLLNQERAEETMDPDAGAHAQRLADATRELEEVQMYLKYISDMEADRRAEVDPVLKSVLVRHKQAQIRDLAQEDGEASIPTAGMLKDDRMARLTPDAQTGSSVSSERAPVATAAVVAAPTAEMADDGAVAIPADTLAATVAHPFVTARLIGLEHENNYRLQQVQLVDEEMRAVESKRTGLRHSRAELQALEAKYKNSEDIRELLGLDL